MKKTNKSGGGGHVVMYQYKDIAQMIGKKKEKLQVTH